jgi:hypothetical protein
MVPEDSRPVSTCEVRLGAGSPAIRRLVTQPPLARMDSRQGHMDEANGYQNQALESQRQEAIRRQREIAAAGPPWPPAAEVADVPASR